jgi:hypothetical protein
MKTKIKVKSIRYFKTNRGVGYQAKTNIKGATIWNDGNGGETYLQTETPKRENKELYKLTEWDLERLLDVYEKGKGIFC